MATRGFPGGLSEGGPHFFTAHPPLSTVPNPKTRARASGEQGLRPSLWMDVSVCSPSLSETAPPSPSTEGLCCRLGSNPGEACYIRGRQEPATATNCSAVLASCPLLPGWAGQKGQAGMTDPAPCHRGLQEACRASAGKRPATGRSLGGEPAPGTEVPPESRMFSRMFRGAALPPAHSVKCGPRAGQVRSLPHAGTGCRALPRGPGPLRPA